MNEVLVTYTTAMGQAIRRRLATVVKETGSQLIVTGGARISKKTMRLIPADTGFATADPGEIEAFRAEVWRAKTIKRINDAIVSATDDTLKSIIKLLEG